MTRGSCSLEPLAPPVPDSAERVSATSSVSGGVTRSSPSPGTDDATVSGPTVGPIPDGDHSPPQPAPTVAPASIPAAKTGARDAFNFTDSLLRSTLGLATNHESCQGHGSLFDTTSHRHLSESLDGAPHRTTGLNAHGDSRQFRN